ncbi:HAD hydrolase family protein [Streptococcus sp. HF-1907]|uniref:HAD hydrolase family protein n=1 Tax=Streptococcus sp. HF-1907 TaxID=2785793 RepID=UPI001E58F656|nr:HAD hydrolase family protein [Streptococcus sp. HF-1907]
MAFGDGGNDIEMLRLAGQSYAMANAPLLVQNEAKYLAPSNDDGVLSVLEAFLTEED